jgi:Tol biopolymer transport system component
MNVRNKKAWFVAKGHSPTWAPDGSRIAYVSQRHGIHIVRPSGKADRFLVAPPIGRRSWITRMDWQPLQT